jgi:hypothetical protein
VNADIDTLPWVSGHLDSSTFEWFKIAVAEGLARKDAFALAEARISSAGARLPRGKFERQWRGALKWVAKHGVISAEAIAQEQILKPKIDYDRLDGIVRTGCGLYDLWEQSPSRFDDDKSYTEEIIDIIFPDNPWLCVGIGKYEFATLRRETFRGDLSRKEFIVAQPMSAREGVTLEGRRSQHTLANTGPRKHYVIEFDFREHDKSGRDTEWAPLIRGWRACDILVTDACAALLDHFARFAPLGLVLHSAGKSCHGWFPVGGASSQQLEAFRREAYVLGADPQLFRNKSQFVRMPDGTRSENGQRQTTYFFNPEVFNYGNQQTH